MRTWEFIYRSWYKSIYQWKDEGKIILGEGLKISMEYRPDTKTLVLNDEEMNMKTVKALHSALGQVLREASKE